MKKYEDEILQLSEDAGKAKFVQTQLDIATKNINELLEQERKLKLSNNKLASRAAQLEDQLDNASSQLRTAEREYAQEKNDKLYLKKNLNEKDMLLKEAKEQNVRYKYFIEVHNVINM